MSRDFDVEAVIHSAEQAGFQIVGRADLPGCGHECLAIPSRLSAPLYDNLATNYPQGLYSHQVNAIEAALDADNVCLTTPAASGKSLAFMSAAVDMILREPDARVLAFYPARALIQDQIEKWQALLTPLGMNTGFIDGGVSIELRPEILTTSHVVLLTPDVAHAWLMSNLEQNDVSAFLRKLKLVILDEAHVYEGVFGTNMAYFLRRFELVSGKHTMICSSATVGKPEEFFQKLTGRQFRSFGLDEDGSYRPDKTILLAREVAGKRFESLVSLLKKFAMSKQDRFIAFGDTRKMVELLVAAVHRASEAKVDQKESSDQFPIASARSADVSERHSISSRSILPYRAGYEAADRKEIQEALGKGQLAGVVSTSAMELGIDIGEINLVILLSVPPSMKAFWQRAGRAGRKNPGVCLLINDRVTIRDSDDGLNEYLQRPVEPSWLYLENRYLQYANALCAAFEMGEPGESQRDVTSFEALPQSFLDLLDNELNPTDVVPSDLYPLKQRAQAGPHREFPLRTGVEKSFSVRGRHGIELGNLTLSQTLRETYPGAIYYYMARPYRVSVYNYRKGEIQVYSEKRWTTKPLAQTMVFPRLQGGTFSLYRSDVGFVTEVEVQVSERVVGFIEQRGSVKEEYRYGPGSPFYQRELNRFFETTGVCWYFPDRFTVSETTGSRILQAFSAEFGIQERDLGFGVFHSKESPLGEGKCKGMSIYDSTYGSLRLTTRLAEDFAEVVNAALMIARSQKDSDAIFELEALAHFADGLQPSTDDSTLEVKSVADEDWVVVVAVGGKAMHLSPAGSQEVEVVGHRYTPQGLMYELKLLETPAKYVITPTLSKPGRTIQEIDQQRDRKWMVTATAIKPLHGKTKMIRLNLITGETESID